MDASVNTLLMAGGSALCALVVARGLWSLRLDWQRVAARRKRREASRSAFYENVASVARMARERIARERPWEGNKLLRVMAIDEECDDVKSFYLADPDGKPLPPFLPGQYLTVDCTPPSTEDSEPEPPKKSVVRCYSLSDRAHEEFYRITVKRCLPPSEDPDAPPGAGSSQLHDGVQVGDLLPIGAPSGQFYLDSNDNSPLALIAGGIGITPILSMLNTLAHADATQDIYVVLGMRNGQEYPFRQHMAELAERMPNVRLVVAYSQPTDVEQQGQDYDHAGRVTVENLQEWLPLSDLRYYLCGPARMMQSLVPGLLDRGVADDQIHFEAFGPASIPLRQTSEDIAQQAIGLSVKFAARDSEAVWSAECESLLDLAERAGVPIESGCRVGNCGRCATPVVEGQVTTVKTPGTPPPKGACLACISIPTSPLVLDA